MRQIPMLCTLLLAASLAPTRPPMYVHVMPWFEASGGKVGWHWKMNRTDEEVLRTGKVASHYRPLIGPYDSADRAVVELQVAWMKLAGFDGVLADWYGTQPHYDYPVIHQRTQVLFEIATCAGLKIGVVYEDQTVGNAIRGGLLPAERSAEIARETGAFLAKDWLKRSNWIRLGGKPAVLVFGPQHFGQTEWSEFSKATGEISLITLHRKHPFSQGAFDWPVPSEGLAFSERYAERSKDWGIKVAGAYPRFVDYYEEGGQKGHPDLPDMVGYTYQSTLSAALKSGSEAVQVATWNDWQEGTQIEPSVEFQYRDLKITQNARRRLDPAFQFRPADFELPLEVYRWRRERGGAEQAAKASDSLLKGDLAQAKALLSKRKQ